MSKIRLYYAALVALVVSIFAPVAAFAQATPTPLESLQTDATEIITSIGVLAAALAVAMLAIKAIPVAYKWVNAFLNR